MKCGRGRGRWIISKSPPPEPRLRIVQERLPSITAGQSAEEAEPRRPPAKVAADHSMTIAFALFVIYKRN